MARTFVGLLVAAMFSLTGYYAYATFGDKDYAPTAVIAAERPACCQAKLDAKKKSCCSESGECTGECHKQARVFKLAKKFKPIFQARCRR